MISLASCQHLSEDSSSMSANPHSSQEAAVINMQLGLAYFKQGNTTRAKKKLLLAMSQAPQSAEVNAAMAYYFENTGDESSANEYYLKALSLSKKSGSQLNNYGAFLCRKGQYLKAIDYFVLATKDMSYLHTAGAYENAGLCASEIPNEALAKGFFQKALIQDPKRKQSLYQLLVIDMQQNQYQEALTLIKQYPGLIHRSPNLESMAKKIAKVTNDEVAIKEYQP